MLTKRKLLIALALLIVIAGGCWLATRDTSPTYEAKHAREWFWQYVASCDYATPDEFARLEAKVALRQLGQPAVELLLHEARRPREQSKFAQIVGEVRRNLFRPSQTLSFTPDTAVYAASQALSDIRPPADQLLPLLQSDLSDPGNITNFSRALWFLSCIGKDSEQAVPFLTEALQHTNQRFYAVASMSVAHLGPKAKATVPSLIAALDHRVLSAPTFVMLSAIGPDASNAVPKLNSMLAATDDQPQRMMLAMAIVGIDSTRTDAIEILRTGLWSDDETARTTAASAVQQLGRGAEALAPDFFKMMTQSKNRFGIGFLKDTLKKISPKAAIDALRVEVDSAQNVSNRVAAAGAILRIDPRDKLAADHLKWVIETAAVTPTTRVIALEQLGEVTPEDKKAVELLNKFLTSPDQNLKTAAQRGLKLMRLRQLDASTN